MSCSPSPGHSDSRGRLLSIESTCDETAAAVIDRDLTVLSSIVASQDDLHERFGGVVPEIASRAHVRNILPVVDEALRRADCKLDQLDVIAVTTRPGLVGSLLVGLTAAKTIAMLLGRPLIAVNHVEAHIYACRMAAGRDVFPAIGLVASGGHSNLYDCPSPVDFRLLGSTVDDAAGEAFDKVARVLELPYPGGPAIEAAAKNGDPAAFDFPRAFLADSRLEFSFSGIKTAVLYAARGTPGAHRPVPPLTEQRVADLAASFQEAVVEVLVGKCLQAARKFDRQTICVGGGVAANSRLRDQLESMAQAEDLEVIVAPKQYCTDNAAMGGIAWELLDAGRTAEPDVDVRPGPLRKAD